MLTRTGGVSPLLEFGGTPGGPEIVLLPPGGGGVLQYAGLAGALRAHGHVTAIRARGLLAGEQPDTSVSAMIDRYLPLVTTTPWLLLGWSLGGVLAWEIATRLPEPPVVIMVDSFPAWGESTPESRAAGARRIVDRMGGGLAGEQRDRLAHTALAHVEAASRHRVVRPYGGDVLLVACGRERPSDPVLDWGGLAERLRVAVVDCTHHEALTAPHLAQVIDHVEGFLGDLPRSRP
jgi:thioesterase domain-containing protein